jgi:hypothetical protein
MAEEKKKKQDVRAIFWVIGFLAFVMLGYLGIRSYKISVEKLKINQCRDDIIEIVMNMQDKFRNQRNYGEFDYNKAVAMKIIPKRMFHAGIKDAVHSYIGGIDFFYSSLDEDSPHSAFEVSFQGISKMACMDLFKMDWGTKSADTLIAVAAYTTPTASGQLDEIYPSMKQSDIKKKNIYMANDARFIADDKLEAICGCKKDQCSLVWKFR